MVGGWGEGVDCSSSVQSTCYNSATVITWYNLSYDDGSGWPKEISGSYTTLTFLYGVSKQNKCEIKIPCRQRKMLDLYGEEKLLSGVAQGESWLLIRAKDKIYFLKYTWHSI